MAAASHSLPISPTSNPPSNTPPDAEQIRIAYDPTFEDSLMDLLLDPPSDPAPGITILNVNSVAPSIPDTQLHPRDLPVLEPTLPLIPASDLPLPLDDARRIYASPIPGLLLTHPWGMIEGGPGPDPATPAVLAISEDLKRRRPRGVKTSERLRRVAEQEQREVLEDLRVRMRARREARAANEEVEREIKILEREREVERKVEERMRKRLKGE